MLELTKNDEKLRIFEENFFKSVNFCRFSHFQMRRARVFLLKITNTNLAIQGKHALNILMREPF